MFKIIKKITKSIYISRGPHVDATWHSRPCGSTTRAHAAPTRAHAAYIYIDILHILYSRGFQPSVHRFIGQNFVTVRSFRSTVTMERSIVDRFENIVVVGF